MSAVDRSLEFCVAIVGIGAIAEVIARALKEIPRVKLVAGSCRTEAKGRKFASDFGCQWFSDTMEMLDRAHPDVAIVCTPSGAHLEVVLDCAQRRIHVICEKPLEITAGRVKQMIDAADQAGIQLGAIFPQRFNPVNAVLHAAAREGRFGNLAIIQGTVPWWREDSYYAPDRWQGKLALDGGGALMNQAIHTVDLMQWFAGATMPDLAPDQNPVEEVFAFTAKRSHDPKSLEVEDTAMVSMRFRSGALGQLLAATSMWPGTRRRIVLGGRDGSAEALEDQLVQFQFRTERPDDEQMRKRLASATQHGGGASNPMAMSGVNHRLNLSDFFTALEQNRPPALTGIEAAKAVQIIDACYESARTGKPVAIDE
jgi:predicted dehydrogenase